MVVLKHEGKSPMLEYRSMIMDLYLKDARPWEDMSFDKDVEVYYDLNGTTIYGLYSSWDKALDRIERLTGKPYDWGL